MECYSKPRAAGIPYQTVFSRTQCGYFGKITVKKKQELKSPLRKYVIYVKQAGTVRLSENISMFMYMHLHNYMQMGYFMKRFTISVPDDLKQELDSMPDINWAEVARKGIEDKLKRLEKFEVLEKRGEL